MSISVERKYRGYVCTAENHIDNGVLLPPGKVGPNESWIFSTVGETSGELKTLLLTKKITSNQRE